VKRRRVRQLRPKPPGHLCREARAEWSRVALRFPEAAKDPAGQESLVMFSTQAVRWQEAEKQIVENGTLIAGPNGQLMESPWVKIANASQRLMNLHLKTLQKIESAKATEVPALTRIGGEDE